jgi:hypothetical protein
VLKLAHIPYILAWHLQIDADSDPDFFMRIRMLIQVTKMMQIQADLDPQQ